MKRPSTFLLALFLLTIIGCAPGLKDDSGGISNEKWCDKDEDKPWSGCWREVRQIDCESEGEFEPAELIGELRLKSDGVYSITWHPFEYYTDYAGSYKVDEAQGSITFDHIDAPAFDGNGTFVIRESGDLVLTGIWFGSFYKDTDTAPQDISCGYVFHKK